MEYLAQAVASALKTRPVGVNVAGSEAHILSDNDARELFAIPLGKAAASRYQNHVAKILTAVFSEDLVFIDTEVRQQRGRKRIDIAYRNSADEGFFRDLSDRHGIKCPVIPVECKNYTADLGNPEFDQLAGRLNKKVGSFGILTCRSNEDRCLIEDLALALADKQEKFVLVLEDSDFTQLISARLNEDRRAIDGILHDRLEPLILD